MAAAEVAMVLVLIVDLEAGAKLEDVEDVEDVDACRTI